MVLASTPMTPSTPATPNRNGYLSSPPPAPRKSRSLPRNPRAMPRGKNLGGAFDIVAER